MANVLVPLLFLIVSMKNNSVKRQSLVGEVYIPYVRDKGNRWCLEKLFCTRNTLPLMYPQLIGSVSCTPTVPRHTRHNHVLDFRYSVIRADVLPIDSVSLGVCFIKWLFNLESNLITKYIASQGVFISCFVNYSSQVSSSLCGWEVKGAFVHFNTITQTGAK